MRRLHVAVQSQADSGDVLGGVPERARAPLTATTVPGVVRVAPERGDRESGSATAPEARWELSDHAVFRYRQRCPGKRDVSLAQAIAELTELSARAHYVKTLESGLELWRCGKPWRLRFRVERGLSGKPRLVTVLRGCDS